MAVSGDRIPEVGEVWTSKSDFGSQGLKVLAVMDGFAWVLLFGDNQPLSASVEWCNDYYVPPRWVSREMLAVRATSGRVLVRDFAIDGDTVIGTIIVYDDNTIEVKNATD